MKRNLLFMVACFVCALAFGQGEIDAHRYSNNDLSGTARGQAMGGAFGALGGDVTGVAINPAGIGVYRSSEVVANMTLTSPLTSGNTNQQSNTSFHFDNLSYVGYYPLINGSMLSLNFGFNYNRVKSFDQNYSTSRPTMNSSLTDYMALLTNGIGPSTWDGDYYNNPNVPWLSALAWDGYLLKEPDKNNIYESILDPGARVSPSLKVSERGKVENYDFTIGSNIANKFFWGATFSIVDLSYSMTSSYDESFLGVSGRGMTLNNSLDTRGSGYQMKVGVIFKPSDALRIGAAYHSPVWYSMTDYYWAGLTPRGINMGDGNLAGFTSTPDNAATNYQFRTPGSWTFSAAAVLGTQAVVSLDYEMKNYASMNLKDNSGNDWTYENGIINEDFKNTSTVRAGLEIRFTPQFSGRLGYAWMQNPYSTDIQSLGKIVVPAGTIPNYTLTGDVNYMTAGLGFRFTPQFYGDFALVLRTQKDNVYYFPSGVPTENGLSKIENWDGFENPVTNKWLKGLITFGYRF